LRERDLQLAGEGFSIFPSADLPALLAVGASMSASRWADGHHCRMPAHRPAKGNPPIGGISSEKAAALLNVGERSVERAKTVQRTGAPEL